MQLLYSSKNSENSTAKSHIAARITPTDTPTLSESIAGLISGAPLIVIVLLHSFFTNVRRPEPSEPNIITIGPFVPTLCRSANSMVFSAIAWSLAPTVAIQVQSFRWHLLMKEIVDDVKYDERNSVAPDDALTTTGEIGAQFFDDMINPSTPWKYALRNTEPRFCGSEISSKRI